MINPDYQDLLTPLAIPDTITVIQRPRLNTRNRIRHNLEPRINKYQRLSEITNVTGFVVNVHDPTNFDIDLDLPASLTDKYQNVICNTYTYQQIPTNFFDKGLEEIYTGPILTSTAYRCRLRGVGINQLPASVNIWKSNQICNEVKKIIDQTDGWVTCTVSDIDVYQRLLVDIVVHTPKKSINLRDYLLELSELDDYTPFYEYTGRRK